MQLLPTALRRLGSALRRPMRRTSGGRIGLTSPCVKISPLPSVVPIRASSVVVANFSYRTDEDTYFEGHNKRIR